MFFPLSWLECVPRQVIVPRAILWAPHVLQLICFIIPHGLAAPKPPVGNGLWTMQASKLCLGIFFCVCVECYLAQTPAMLGTINSSDDQAPLPWNNPSLE